MSVSDDPSQVPSNVLLESLLKDLVSARVAQDTANAFIKQATITIQELMRRAK